MIALCDVILTLPALVSGIPLKPSEKGVMAQVPAGSPAHATTVMPPGRGEVFSRDDDDVYYYIRWRLKLEGETENMGVCTKERKGITAEVLRATPCTNSLGEKGGFY